MTEELPATQTRDASVENRAANCGAKSNTEQSNTAETAAPRDSIRGADNPIKSANTPENKEIDLPRSRAAVRGAAEETKEDLFADLSKYTHTVGQSTDRFVERGREAPKERRMQELCSIGRIDCHKIKTTRDGKHVSEWLVNLESLDAFIDARPQIRSANQTGRDADDERSSDASQRTANPAAAQTVETERKEIPPPQGETRTLVEVLIENARITAEAEGKEKLVGELREDREFLREEVREARKYRGDVKAISERMLEALETISLGGRLTRLNGAPRDGAGSSGDTSDKNA